MPKKKQSYEGVEEWQLALVQPIEGETLRFRVYSETDKSIAYIVDLRSFNVAGRRNGACECDNFTKKRLMALRKLGKPQAATRCKHIKWAMQYHAEETLPLIAENTGHEKYTKQNRSTPRP